MACTIDRIKPFANHSEKFLFKWSCNFLVHLKSNCVHLFVVPACPYRVYTKALSQVEQTSETGSKNAHSAWKISNNITS